MKTVLSAAASAVEEPEIPAKIMPTTTVTWAKPPLMWPTSVMASLIKRWVMPPSFMILPERIKNGIARRTKLSTPL